MSLVQWCPAHRCKHAGVSFCIGAMLGATMLVAGVAAKDTTGRTIVVVADSLGIAALTVTLQVRTPRLRLLWKVTGAVTSPVLANGVLFVAGGDAIRAIDLVTGRALWRSDSSNVVGSVGDVHWQSPVVCDGRVFLPDNRGSITAYGLR